MQKTIQETIQDLIAVLWPTECVCCGLPDRDICASCKKELLQSRQIIKVPLFIGMTEFQGPKNPAPFLYSCGIYDEPIKKIIVALKHQNRVTMANILADVLEPLLKKMFLQSALQPPVWLVLIPSRKKRERQRGFSHLQVVTRKALKQLRLSVPIKKRVLIAAYGRKGQVGLTGKERELNAAKIKIGFKYRKKLAHKRIILVDDIVTSGATLRAAAAILHKNDAQVLGAITFSVTQKRLTEAYPKHAA